MGDEVPGENPCIVQALELALFLRATGSNQMAHTIESIAQEARFRFGQVKGDDLYQAGYAAAKAEMVGKLTEFRPTYVEGGRVPEDAIEHRNQPRGNDGPAV